MASRFARGKWLLPLVAAAAVAAMVSASVFVVYPVSGTLSFTKPPIVLNAGSNAGQADLGSGNTITVTLGENQTSASITLHPTYETTYYYSVLYVNNTDNSSAYYVRFKLSTSSTLPSGEQITALIYNATGYLVGSVTINSTVTSNWNNGWLTLAAGKGFRVDFKIVYPEGQPLPSTQSFTLSIVYSNQNTENPPAAATS